MNLKTNINLFKYGVLILLLTFDGGQSMANPDSNTLFIEPIILLPYVNLLKQDMGSNSFYNHQTMLDDFKLMANFIERISWLEADDVFLFIQYFYSFGFLPPVVRNGLEIQVSDTNIGRYGGVYMFNTRGHISKKLILKNINLELTLRTGFNVLWNGQQLAWGLEQM